MQPQGLFSLSLTAFNQNLRPNENEFFEKIACKQYLLSIKNILYNSSLNKLTKPSKSSTKVLPQLCMHAILVSEPQ